MQGFRPSQRALRVNGQRVAVVVVQGMVVQDAILVQRLPSIAIML